MFKEITSLQHPLVKHLVKLRQESSYRKECSKLLLSGNKQIVELSTKVTITRLLIEKGSSCPLEAAECIYVTPEILKKVTGVAAPESMAAEVQMPLGANLEKAAYLLVLDQLSDPGNLGTLFRSAAALGWDAIFLTSGSSDPFNEKALRAAKGAVFTLPWKKGTEEELLELLKNRAVFAAEATGQSVIGLNPTPPLSLILGNESHGISPHIKKIATSIGIPMQKDVESLNVGAAGSILMHVIKNL